MSISLMTSIFFTEFRDLPRPEVDENQKPKMTKASTAKILLLAIADQANDEGESAYPGFTKLEIKTGLSRQGIADTLEALKHNGLIEIDEEKSKLGTNIYTINPACFPGTNKKDGIAPLIIQNEASQATLLVKPLADTGQATLPALVKPLDLKHTLNQQETSYDDVQKIISKANPKVNAILEQAFDVERGWLGREKMPEAMRDLLDVFVECSGVKPTRGQVNDWFATGSDWLEIGAKKQDILDAFEKSKPNIDLKRTGFTVGRPGSLTTTLQAVVGERRKSDKPKSLTDFMNQYLEKHGK